LSGSRRDL
jgi:hypothetical protein